MTEPEYKVR